MRYFVTLCTTHLPNTGPLSYSHLPKCWHVLQYQQMILSVTKWSYQRSLRELENFHAYCDRPKFSKILIFTWKIKFYHWQPVLFFFEVTGLLFSNFEKITDSNHENHHGLSLSVVFSNKNSGLWKKWLVSVRNSNTQLLFWASHWYLLCIEVFHAYLQFNYRTGLGRQIFST